MPDFVSQSSFERGLEPPTDALGHQELAQSIISKLTLLPAGSVVGLHGEWGRGKTDLLSRIALATYQEAGPSAFAPRALWINPWQYGTPDLLSPVVIGLLERVSIRRRSGAAALRKAAESVVKAGLSFGLKAVGLTIPGGRIYEAAAEEAKSLLEGLFEAAELQPELAPDPDPVAAMGERFAELVAEMLDDLGLSDSGRLLILIDDLDRCAPDRQVALLESIRFLVSAGARATFVIALDPVLARQAIRTHYRTDAFDPDQYLEKIFSLRLYLPAMSYAKVRQLLDVLLSEGGGGDVCSPEVCLRKKLAIGKSELSKAVDAAFTPPDFRNPRLLARIVNKLHLLSHATEESPELLRDEEALSSFIVWLCLSERWPQFRTAMQTEYRKTYPELFEELLSYYTVQFSPLRQGDAVDPESSARARALLATLGLPPLEQASRLLAVLEWVSKSPSSLAHLQEFDGLLLGAGL